MTYTMMLIISIVIVLALGIGVIPLLIVLRPNLVNYLTKDDNGNILLNEKLNKVFEYVKCEYLETEQVTNISFHAKDNIKQAYLSLSFKKSNKKLVKHIDLDFFSKKDIVYHVKGKVDSIAIFVNKINDEIYKEHVIQHVKKSNVIWFAILESILFGTFISILMAMLIYSSTFIYHSTFEIPCLIFITIISIIVMFLIILPASLHLLRRYTNGGYIHD